MTERRDPGQRGPEQRGREERFDEELRRAARALVSAELPPGVLDPSVGASLGTDRDGRGLGGGNLDGRVRGRRAMPGFTAAAAAAAVLLIATAVALAPGIGPGASPAPSATPAPTPSPDPTAAALRTTDAIVADLIRLEYTCEEGNPVESLGPGPDPVARESAVCLAPEAMGPFMAAVIVGETAEGRVVEVDAKADFVGEDTPAARDELAGVLAKAAAIAVGFPGTGNDVGDWVVATLPTLERSTGDVLEAGGISVKIVRNATGGYLVIVHAG